uniref:Uncharacterized protein n=1 Tax=Arundo donax TaxID=35708 RepID=A0A0A9C5C9_ARUDO
MTVLASLVADSWCGTVACAWGHGALSVSGRRDSRAGTRAI